MLEEKSVAVGDIFWGWWNFMANLIVVVRIFHCGLRLSRFLDSNYQVLLCLYIFCQSLEEGKVSKLVVKRKKINTMRYSCPDGLWSFYTHIHVLSLWSTPELLSLFCHLVVKVGISGQVFLGFMSNWFGNVDIGSTLFWTMVAIAIHRALKI